MRNLIQKAFEQPNLKFLIVFFILRVLNIRVICEQTFPKESTFQINYEILFGIALPIVISTKGLFLVLLTFVNNLSYPAVAVNIMNITGPNYRTNF